MCFILDSRKISYPHKITEVRLQSKSPLLANKHSEILSLLKEKYPNGEWGFSNIYDLGETWLSVNLGKNKFTIRYFHRAEAPMKRLYQAHEVSKAKKANTPDQAEGL